MMEIGGHTVVPEHYAVLECPVCKTERKVYHLGSADGVEGWVCGVCTATLEENHETHEVERVTEAAEDED